MKKLSAKIHTIIDFGDRVHNFSVDVPLSAKTGRGEIESNCLRIAETISQTLINKTKEVFYSSVISQAEKKIDEPDFVF